MIRHLSSPIDAFFFAPLFYIHIVADQARDRKPHMWSIPPSHFQVKGMRGLNRLRIEVYARLCQVELHRPTVFLDSRDGFFSAIRSPLSAVFFLMSGRMLT